MAFLYGGCQDLYPFGKGKSHWSITVSQFISSKGNSDLPTFNICSNCFWMFGFRNTSIPFLKIPISKHSSSSDRKKEVTTQSGQRPFMAILNGRASGFLDSPGLHGRPHLTQFVSMRASVNMDYLAKSLYFSLVIILWPERSFNSITGRATIPSD